MLILNFVSEFRISECSVLANSVPLLTRLSVVSLLLEVDNHILVCFLKSLCNSAQEKIQTLLMRAQNFDQWEVGVL